ncbi:choline/carnitine O-acyltransferase [Adonisia turfae]
MSVETRKDPIAIIGLSCRFPGSENPEAFWELLKRGGDAITEIPDSRWDIDAFYDPDPAKPDKMNTRWGGFLPQVDQFDPQFFNISPREAINMDPQQRLLLEVAWEALENANIIPQQTSGKSVGVFTGISTHDYSVLTWGHTQNEPHAAIGTANSIVANRLSYLFNWTGPSMAIDTACSSSLVAVHLACQSLWRGESPLAIAGGANILLLPSSTVSFSKAGFMAADGRCKTFDARADGYVRSEGVGIVVLKPLSQALAEGDRIYAVIRGSAINQDGTSNGITAPNPVSQEAVLRAAYRDADVLPSQVHYVETHGTGTKLGDYIELKSLGKVLAEGRQPGDICRVGAVKANIGHLEAAAGIAGLIKVALSLKQREFPPQALFESPNPHIKFHKLPIRVQQKLEHLPEQDGPILVGISSFGFGGTNAHLVLESAPVQSGKQRPNSLQSHHPPEQRPLNLLTLSAKTDQALKALAVSYQNYLETHPEVDLTDICYTTNVGRSHFDHRLVVTANSISDLQQKLQDFCAGETAPGITEGVLAVTASQPKVAFLFSGQGSQYFRMGQQLYETQPIFRQILEQCDAILKLQPHLERSLLEVLYSAADPELMTVLLNQTAYTQPALFAIEYALCQLWKSWGIQPEIVMGHSVGEIVAACVAGVFSLEDGLILSAMRGQLMQQLPPGGVMVSSLASVEHVKNVIAARENVTIAAINGPESTVISGEESAVLAVAQQLEAQGIKTKQIQVSHAFHSPLMAPMLSEFEQVVRQISYSPPTFKLISNVTGQIVSEEIATPEYWCEHILAPVNFAAGMESLQQEEMDIFLECGPQPILLGMGHQCLPEDEEKAWLPSLRPGQSDWQQMLSSLSQLYVRGVNIDWIGFGKGYPQRRKVSLPTYPFQRQRYWIDVVKQQAPTSLNNSQVTELLAQGDVLQLSQMLSTQGQSPLATETIEQLVKVHQQQLAAQSVQNLLYEVQWQLQAAPAISENQPHHWLIFANPGELAHTIADQLHHHGQTHTLVNLVSEPPQNDEQGAYVLQPDSPDSYTQLWTHLSQINTLPIAGILWLSSSAEVNLVELTSAVLDRTVNQQCIELLYLMQSLVQHPELAQTKLWVVTENGVALGSDEPTVVQAPVRGMSRIFGLEHPHQWGGLIDLDSHASTEQQAQFLTDEVLTNQTEEQVTYRDNKRYIARLVRSQPKSEQPLSIHPEGSYLLSGGLGGLGLTVAKWLVEQGARHLILLSRHGANTSNKQAVIAQLQSMGAQVVMPEVDINDEVALQTTLSLLPDSFPPIRGVLHVAGIDGGFHPIKSLEQSTLEQTLAPKVKGTWNLHQLSLAWELDFFVTFSSIAAVWGSAYQAHYGAANEFQNLFTQYRHSQGLPSLTINWSAIVGAGMLSQTDASQVNRLSEIGITPLQLRQMTAVLGLLLRTQAKQCVVAAVDWQKLDAVYQTSRPRCLLEQLVEPELLAAPQASVQTAWLEQIQLLPVTEQGVFLQHTVQQEVAIVLGLSDTALPDPQVGFFELGMDSLMAVELRSRLTQLLGVTLPSTVAFDFPNIEQLSHYLAAEVLYLTAESQGKATQPLQRPTLDEPIAIVGMGCRLPGGIESPEQFWQLLQTGQDARSQVPAERWDIDAYYDPDPEAAGKMLTRYGHFVEGVDQFDPSFFGISPREAVAIDPQHRLLLEVSWEALEGAGQKLERLSAAVVGVFVGNDGHDYEQRLQQHLQQSPESPLATYVGTGNHISSAAGRLAYTLGFTGPTITLDTACSSSLVAVHQACNSLRLSECQMALAGGVKLHLTPDSYIATSRARMLSADGYCKTFDESADGYGRGEGCGIIVLKRLSDAERAGDPILALIRGSAVNQDGPSSGLTVPNGQAQQRLMKQALAQAKVLPTEVSYLEAHGTGTSLGDPIEVNAAMAVLGEERSEAHPLWIGSVKTNIGHLEAAAGISGLIKVVLSLQHQQIPPHLHLHQPNPKIDWQPWLQVPQALTQWQCSGQRLAGVSSFGFTGTNAHVVLEEAPMAVDLPQVMTERPLQVLAISAKTEAGLTQLAQRYRDHLVSHPQQALSDVCFSASSWRLAYAYRLAVVAETAAALAEQLSAFTAGQMGPGLVKGVLDKTETPKVAILFTGQGSQYVGMARELYETQPTFRQALEQCHEILKAYLDRPLLEVIYPDESTEQDEALLNQTAYTQPALFAIEYALYQLWQSWGIIPSVVMGHSIGEIVAACIAGVFSLENGLKLSAMRGKLMQQLPSGGAMVSVMASVEQVRTVIADADRDNVTIAAINGPESTVISGESTDVQALAQQLEEQGIKTKQLQVSHAFHSPLMEPMLAEFEQVVKQINYSLPTLKLISNVTGQVVTEEVATPQYWSRHILASVNFASGMETLQQEEIDIFLECGPQPILLGMGRQCLPENDEKSWLPSLRPEHSDWQQMLSSLSQLYIRGVNIDWVGFDKDYPQRRKVFLPTYPFQRQRYWIDIARQRTLLNQVLHPLLGVKTELAGGDTLYSQQFNPHEGWLADHQVYQTTIMPGAGLAAMALASHQGPVQLHDMFFERPLLVSESCELQLRLEAVESSEQHQFTIYSRKLSQAGTWQLHSYGLINSISLPSEFLDIELLRSHLQSCSVQKIYEQLGSMGLELGPAFRGIQQLWGGVNEALAELMLPEGLTTAESIEPIHPVLLDACTQTLFGAIDKTLDDVLYLPLQYQQLELYRPAPSHLFCYAQTVEIDTTAQTVTAQLTFADEQGDVFGKLQGLVVKRAVRDAMLRELIQPATHLLYKTEWQPVDLHKAIEPEIAASRWLILGEADVCTPLSERLLAQGQSVICGSPAQLKDLLNEGFVSDHTEHDLNAILTGIVLVSAVNTGDIATETELNADTVLQVVQMLLAQDVHLPQGLTLITQQAIAVDATADVVPAQSALWGLGRTIQVEQPQLSLRLLDVDSLDAVSLSAGSLKSMEAQCVLREKQIFVPRLTRAHLDISEPLTIRADGSYLITGGLGALGLQACQWLLEQGAQHVVLSSRRDADDAIRQQLTEFEQTYGGTVEVQATDVANPEQVSELISGFGPKWPPLAGLIHAAGILDDGSISEQTPERFARVLAPKVQGAWHLHQATMHHDLDFFVLYSSATATLGSAGQSNYATANAFLDGLAQHRRALERCGTSINWGPWANVGMAAGATVRANLAKRGLVPLQTQAAHQAMAQLLATDAPTGVVLDVDWNRMGRHLGGVRPSILSQLISQPALTGQNELMQQLRKSLPADRSALLLRHLQRELQQILGLAQLPNPDVGFFDLGMDSLMAVEFRNRLQVQLRLDIPVTQFMEKANVLALAQLADQQLSLETPLIDADKTQVIPHKDTAVSESDSGADLPKIPLPSLTETCDRYLEIVTPLLTESGQRKTKTAVEAFRTGSGIRLQKLLEIHHNSTSKGYMYDFREQEFLSIRKPLSFFQNYNLLFEASPQISELKWSRQIALLSSGVLHFYMKIKTGTLEPDKVGDIPLCMHQYARLFRTNRIPKIAQDILYDPTQHQDASLVANEHFIVAYDNQFYVIAIDLNNADTLVQQVERQIDDILSAPKEKTPAVGLLTTLHRTEWAVLRPALALSNEIALKAIDAALFVLCLDRELPDTLEAWSQQILYGNGGNRWFDKTLQLIVTPGCQWGANVDHAPVDSLLIARLLRDVSQYIDTFLDQRLVDSDHLAQTQDRLTRPPTRLEWSLSKELTQSIERAKLEFDQLSQTFQFHSLTIDGLGEELIDRHQFKNSEAIAQLILQLAYARCHGRVDNIYQPVSTRHFRYGRTEVLRPVTPESLHLIQCFERGANADDCYVALCQAMAKHDQRKSLCISGYGVDRHLFALHELAKQQKDLPEIFQDEAYTQVLTKSVMATSGFMESFLTKFMGTEAGIERGMYPGLFAPDTPEGYGYIYILMRDRFFCSVTSWSDSITQFTQCLQQSAEDFKALLISQMPLS